MRTISMLCAVVMVIACDVDPLTGPTTEDQAFIDELMFYLDGDKRLAGDVAGTLTLETGIRISRRSPLERPIRAVVSIDGVQVDEITINPRSENQFTQRFTTQIPTDELNANGGPLFRNGVRTLSVKVINEDGAEVASKTSALRFQNADQATATVVFDNGGRPTHVIDANGQVWNAGSLKIDFMPGAFYSEGRSPLLAAVNLLRQDNSSIAQFSAPMNGGVASVVANHLQTPPAGIRGLTFRPGQISATVMTNQGPLNVTLPQLFIDNEAPTVGNARLSLPASGYLNASSNVPGLVTGAAQIQDQGSGPSLVRVQVVDVAGGWRTFVDAGELNGTSVHRVRAVALDRAGNETILPGEGDVRMDGTPPTIARGPRGAADRTVVTSADARFEFVVTDAQSGVPPEFAAIASLRMSAPHITGAAACIIGSHNPANATNPCQPVPSPSSFPVPPGDGIFTASVNGIDVAGNQSTNPITVRVIRDPVAATINSPAVTLAPNGNALFTFVANDNLSVAKAASYFLLPYAPGTTIGLGTVGEQPLSQFGELAGQVNVSFEMPPITSVQLSQSTGLVATLPAAVLNNIVEAVDHGGNRTLADVPKLPLPAGTDARLRGVQNFITVQPTARLCNGDLAAPPCPPDAVKTVDIVIQATTPVTVTTSPFASTYIWMRDPAAQRFFMEGTSSQPTSTVSGDVRDWRWTIPVSAEGYAPQNQAVVITGGLHRDGGLVLAAPRVVNIIAGS